MFKNNNLIFMASEPELRLKVIVLRVTAFTKSPPISWHRKGNYCDDLALSDREC